MKSFQNFINGRFREPAEGDYLDVFEPATGKAYGKVSNSSVTDLEEAIKAARSAQPQWANMGQERSKILFEIGRLIAMNQSELAMAESVDTGKPVDLCHRLDIPRSAQNFHFFASCLNSYGSSAYPSRRSINYTDRVPLGIIASISPWNLPLYLLTWKLAPALAFGNAVIAKPSEVTPATAHLLAELCQQAGLPPGVLAILHGTGHPIGQAIVEHQAVSGISFTGSTETGRKLAALAAPKFKKISLEMGGKNPIIIFADCDITEAVTTTLRSSFLNQGQICLCGSRIYVERSIFYEFQEKFVALTKTLEPSDPLKEGTWQGAIVSQQQFDKVLHYIELAKNEGGELLAGGQAVTLSGRCEKGWFVQPTIFSGLPDKALLNQHEVFGPVVTLMPFDDEEEVVHRANGTRYGLSATIWTQNLPRAHRLAKKIDAGVIWVNTWLERDLRTPFGGMKDSGLGREGGEEAFRFFTEPKNICIQFDDGAYS